MSDPPTQERCASRLPRIRLALACGAAAFLINIFASNDWCFAAFTAGILAGLVVACIDVVLGRIGATTVVRVALGVIVAGTVGFCLKLDTQTAFDIVFKASPPEGVRNVVADREYAGGPGDQLLLMQFHTDSATLDRLLAHRGFAKDQDVLQEWHELFQDHKTLWEHVFGGLLPDGHVWRNLPPPADAVVYHGGEGITPKIVVLFDAANGIAYVMYTFG